MSNNEIDNIYKWLSLAGVSKNKTNKLLNEDQFILFLKLMIEELSETAESGGEDVLDAFNQLMKKKVHDNERLLNRENIEPDYTLFRDGMADLYVVLQNGNYMSGASIKDVLTDINEVMKSNFSKYCITKEEANKTVEWYKKNKDVDSYIVENKGFYIVKRKEDNKILKSVNFKNPKL